MENASRRRLPRLPGRLALPLAGVAALALMSACNPPVAGGDPTPTASATGGGGTFASGHAATPGQGGTAGQGGTVKVQAFPVPTAGSDLSGIAAGPDGSLWFTEEEAHKVGHITTAGQITEYPIQDNNVGVSDTGPTVIVRSGGAMWFTDDVGSDVFRIAPDGTYRAFYRQQVYTVSTLAPSASGGVWLMMRHGDGVDSDGDAVVLIGPDGKLSGYPATHPNSMDAIALAPDGSVWYNNEANSLNKLTESGQEVRDTLSSTSAAEVSSIAFTRDGTPWFTAFVPGYEAFSGCCGAVGGFFGGAAHVTLIGSQRGFSGILPYSLIAGPDGALWFAFSAARFEGYAGIGRIDPTTGKVELASTGTYVAAQIAFGADRALWFADRRRNLIGRIQVGDLRFQPVSGG